MYRYHKELICSAAGNSTEEVEEGLKISLILGLVKIWMHKMTSPSSNSSNPSTAVILGLSSF